MTGWRERLQRFAASQETVHAAQERKRAVQLGGTPIGECTVRKRALYCGTLRSVTLRPRAGVPALVAELYDGSGSLSVIWMGRRRLAGVEPGRVIRVEGMLTQGESGPTMFNPRYELVPVHG